MSTAPVDLTKMSSAEIKAFIESQNIVPDTTDQPRDENGRFTKTEESIPPVNESTETQTETTPEPITVEKEIDLGDGSGIQIFRGVGATEIEAYAALTDELAKAQTNATRKIQELSKPAPAPAPTPAELTPENEFLLQQRLLDSPRATIREVLKEEFGLSPAEIKQKLQAADEAAEQQKASAATDAFLAANPDYFANDVNGKRMLRELKAIGPATRENIQKAYESLKADGLLVTRQTDPAAPAARPRSSGLSSRSSAPPPPPARVDLTKLTTEQLRELSGGYQNIYR